MLNVADEAMISKKFENTVSYSPAKLKIMLHIKKDSDDYLAFRTVSYYNVLISVLKFWHVFVVYIMFLLNVWAISKSKENSFDCIAMINQNSIYLLLFASICFVFYIKQFSTVVFSNPYFYTNYTYSNFFSSFQDEYNSSYIWKMY